MQTVTFLYFKSFCIIYYRIAAAEGSQNCQNWYKVGDIRAVGSVVSDIAIITHIADNFKDFLVALNAVFHKIMELYLRAESICHTEERRLRVIALDVLVSCDVSLTALYTEALICLGNGNAESSQSINGYINVWTGFKVRCENYVRISVKKRKCKEKSRDEL